MSVITNKFEFRPEILKRKHHSDDNIKIDPLEKKRVNCEIKTYSVVTKTVHDVTSIPTSAPLSSVSRIIDTLRLGSPQ